MKNFTPIPSRNEHWGFWGTSVHNGYDAELTWDAASRFLAGYFDLDAEQACKVLDSRFGRHLADDLSFINGGPVTAEAIARHLTSRVSEKGWRKSFEATIHAETGKTYRRKSPLSRDALFAGIAREHLHIETLEERKSDQLDFHDVGVLSIKAALEAAYEAGRSSKR